MKTQTEFDKPFYHHNFALVRAGRRWAFSADRKLTSSHVCGEQLGSKWTDHLHAPLTQLQPDKKTGEQEAQTQESHPLPPPLLYQVLQLFTRQRHLPP